MVKTLFIKPFRQGYSQQGRPSDRSDSSGSSSREGDVTITYNPYKKRGENHKAGEYIDYEEVEEVKEED